MGDTGGWDDELLGAAEVGRRLGVGPVTVYRWCRQGRLACLKPGKEWRIRRSALEAFLRRAEEGPRPDKRTAPGGTAAVGEGKQPGVAGRREGREREDGARSPACALGADEVIVPRRAPAAALSSPKRGGSRAAYETQRRGR